MKQTEELETEINLPEEISAPVKEGDRLGELTYSLDGRVIAVYPVFAAEDISLRSFSACTSYITDQFLVTKKTKR